MASLFVNPTALEGVFGWLEQNGGQPVQLWGWENNRRTALLAYTDGPGDGFGWSNWAAAARPDPSELCPLFQAVELQVEPGQAAQLSSLFPGGVAAAQGQASGGEPPAQSQPPIQTSSFLGGFSRS